MNSLSRNEKIELLKQFNKKAAKLLSSEFAQFVLTSQLGVQVSVQDKQVKSVLKQPTETQTDAFILTLRFFYQKNEDISFEKMVFFYRNANLNADITTAFFGAIQEINKFLDSQTSYPIQYNEEFLTKRKVIEIFLYGDLAHMNKKEKIKVFQEWFENPLFYPFVKNEFNIILKFLLEEIEYLSLLNKAVLEELVN